MTYRDIEDLQALLDKDIRRVVAKGDIDPKDYQCLDVAVDISKDLCEIATKLPLMEDAVNGYGYNSYNSYNSYADGQNSGGNSYYDGQRYSRTRGTGTRGGRGTSGHMSVNEKLNMMMQNAPNEQERQIISKIMKEMDNM